MPEFAEQYLGAQQAKPELLQQLDEMQLVEPEFFTLLDVARRISGGGTLGLDRYSVLIEGERSIKIDLDIVQPMMMVSFKSSKKINRNI